MDHIAAALGDRTAQAARRAGAASPWLERAEFVVLSVVGLGAGLSPLFYSYYNPAVWLPIGIGLTIAAAATGVLRPPRLDASVVLAVAGIAGLGLWSLLSTGWGQAVEQATVGADRWLAYAALLMLLLVLLRTRRHSAVLLGAVGIGIVAVGATVLVRMLGPDPAQLFNGGRLNLPLGYINGEGCVFAMGAWFCMALAERRHPLLAAPGAAGAVAMACLALLSQSRGAAIASGAAILVSLVFVPGARRRILALAVIAAGVAAASAPVLRVYSTAHGGGVVPSVSHHAATSVIEFSLLAGLAWGLIVALAFTTERLGEPQYALLRRGATVLAIIAIAVPVVAGIARFGSIERTASRQWHTFTHLSEPANTSSTATQTRLLSGAGNRYDYWRVAWHVFKRHPLAGVGAGNYTASYYQERRTTEAIQNPHSLELQTLSELGVVGALLLAMFLAGVVLGASRLRRLARRSSLHRTLMVAATGAFTVWLVDTSGDWMHLLPGDTAIALAAAAVLCRRARGGSARTRRVRPDAVGKAGVASAVTSRISTGALAGAAAALVLVVGGASLLRSEFVQRDVVSAEAALGHDPASAIADAQRALRLDGANLDAYYMEAAGEARFNRAASARSALLAAAHEDPTDFITWVLLGDLEVRLHKYRSAKRFYARAHALDPNDPAVAQLVADPAAALPTRSGR